MTSGPSASVVDRNRELLEQARSFVYRSFDEDGVPDLKAHVFFPEDGGEMQDRTAMLFFFASGWDQGQVSQFAPQALYFAGRGAITIVAEYRTRGSHGTTPFSAMADARNAIRWIRFNHQTLGIDPMKVVVAGGGGGALLGLAAAMIQDYDTAEDVVDASVPLSCVPDALVLFSPVVDLSRKGYGHERFASAAEARKASPAEHIRKQLPPMILFQGGADRLNPAASVERFAKKMKRQKNRCELHIFDGKDHSFYNFNVDMASYEAVVSGADQFLQEHGFLQANTEDDGSARLVSWRPQE